MPALTRSQAPPPEQVRRVANAAVPGGCAGHGDTEGAGQALPSGCMWPGGGGGAGLQGAVFISFCCYNKRPQTQRLQHQECWQPKVWRHLIGLRPRSQQSCVPFRKSCRRVRFLALPASGGRPRCSARAPPTSNATAGRVLFTLHLRPHLLPPLPLLRTHLGPAR